MHRGYIPRVELFVIFRQSAREIVDINVHSRNVTVAQVGADVGTTHVDEVRTESSDGVLADIGDGLVHGRTKQQKADQLVTVEDKAWNGPRQCQLIRRRLLSYRSSWVTLVKVFHYDDLKFPVKTQDRNTGS